MKRVVSDSRELTSLDSLWVVRHEVDGLVAPFGLGSLYVKYDPFHWFRRGQLNGVSLGDHLQAYVLLRREVDEFERFGPAGTIVRNSLNTTGRDMEGS